VEAHAVVLVRGLHHRALQPRCPPPPPAQARTRPANCCTRLCLSSVPQQAAVGWLTRLQHVCVMLLLLQVGWNDPQKYWLVRNSFGAGFADGGYFRVRAVVQQDPCAPLHLKYGHADARMAGH